MQAISTANQHHHQKSLTERGPPHFDGERPATQTSESTNYVSGNGTDFSFATQLLLPKADISGRNTPTDMTFPEISCAQVMAQGVQP